MNDDDDHPERTTTGRLVEEIEAILFHAGAVERAVDDAHDLSPESRRALKRAALVIREEGERLLAWLADESIERAPN